MSPLAKTKADASRALAQTDVTYLVELEVVNESDARALTGFVAAQLRKGKKLRVFVAERVPKRR
jgi:hypothetical protein